MNLKNNLVRYGVCGVAVILTMSCCFFDGTPEASNPYVAPTDVPQAVTELPPLPDFEEQILLFGGGGAGGKEGCDYFVTGSTPSIVGGTTYPKTKLDSNDFDPQEIDFPRRARLCILGVPTDMPITIKLVSPDKTLILSGSITVTGNPNSKWLDVNWPGGVASQSDSNAPVFVELFLWWAGALPGGLWQAEARWPGQTIYGDFFADTRTLPEISLVEPEAHTALFPDTGGFYTCHTAASATSYTVIAEKFFRIRGFTY